MQFAFKLLHKLTYLRDCPRDLLYTIAQQAISGIEEFHFGGSHLFRPLYLSQIDQKPSIDATGEFLPPLIQNVFTFRTESQKPQANAC